jgi:glucose-6-phosphate isomerase
MNLARERKVPEAIAAMFGGQRINETENRAVLHVALRHRGEEPIEVDGQDVMPDVNAVLARIRTFTERGALGAQGLHRQAHHRCGQYRHRRLQPGAEDGLRGAQALSVPDLAAALRLQRRRHAPDGDGPRLDPATTLFIVASKTFTTQETMTNAHSARQWLVAAPGQRGGGGQSLRRRLDQCRTGGRVRHRYR